MYRYILLISVILICAAQLQAQQGLYGLAFRDSHKTVSDKLVLQGFQADNSTASRIIMSPVGEDLIRGIELRFSSESDSLSGWSIGYSDYEEADMGGLVIGALISRHGPGFVKRAGGIYRWDMEDGHTVTAGWDHFRQLFVVDYRGTR
jgi:hypothetical protein